MSSCSLRPAPLCVLVLLALPAEVLSNVALPPLNKTPPPLAREPDDNKSAATDQESLAVKLLKARGIDPAQLGILDNNARFPAGVNVLDLSVNGEFKGTFSVTVNAGGDLCFTPQLIAQLGLKPAEKMPPQGCFAWVKHDPHITTRSEPATLSASIVVPQSWLAPAERANSSETGGAGALLNYSYFNTLNVGRSGRNRYSYLTLEDGLNLGGWMVRSYQQLSQSDGVNSASVSSLYAERALARWQQRLQFGQISVSDTLFAVGDINGVQLIPDNGFEQQEESGVMVEGIASTPQARVEVRQYGVVIYNTLVPAGPFHLRNIPLTNRNSDLEVSVLETDGRQQHFSVPASQLMAFSSAAPRGFSLALGKLRDTGSQGQQVPAIFTLNKSWQPTARLSAQNGIMLAKKYQSLAMAVSGQLLQGFQLAAQIMATNDSYSKVRSGRLSLSASYRLSALLSLSGSVTKNTPNYLTLSEASSRSRWRNGVRDLENTQYSLSASLSLPVLGSVSLSHSESTSFGAGHGTTRYNMLSWSRNISRAMLSVSYARSSGGSGDKQLSVNLTLPLGQQQLSSYYRSSARSSQLGAQTQGALNNNMSYALSTERDLQQRTQSVQGGVNANLHYTMMGVTTQQSGGGSSSYSQSGSGSMALIDRHLLFSSHPVGQTFGLIVLNEPLANVEISTPGGTSWTDWRGLALAPNLQAWRESGLDLNTETLPKRSDVSNGHRSVNLARGAVKRINFSVLTTRRLLLTLQLSDGKPLPRGSMVRDENNKLLTMAIDDGTVYLENSPEKATLHIEIADKQQQCSFSYQLEDDKSQDAPFQKISGVCV
ncbi:fimbria/pilus outer membrane usher protein [Erwinia aphidicola]|uniref:Fimbria/pilus outer membrane usher protein n=1 Tax=Erwinia aphidicola TaxID=68334 RepID=A0ABU8DBH0_ERWAP